MGTDLAVTMARQLLLEALLLCAPMLVAACVVSLVMSLVQTLTGVQEQTLTAVPRLVVVFVLVVVLMPWLAQKTVGYTVELWTNLQRYMG